MWPAKGRRVASATAIGGPGGARVDHQAAQHLEREIDPDNSHVCFGQRQSDAPSPDANFEAESISRKLTGEHRYQLRHQ
jgi:hypothetical protein